jgi:hypothetical protein
MSQITMTNLERRAALEGFGYTEREAQFLCLAALHGGYFLRRQYASFLGGQDGGNVTQLIEKVLDLGHAQADTYKANAHIYHLAARPFYAALGQEDNRNRRRKELVTIKSKLMGLDFILAHLDKDFLATEQEKLSFFKDILHVEAEHLPSKNYASQGHPTTRYFVEKYPISYSPSPRPAAPPVVSFCFVDPGLFGVIGFETFLSHYSGLFTQLREFAVAYVAAKEVLFAKARSTFERFSNGGEVARNGISVNGPTEKILEYFEARRLFEARDFASFDRAKLIRFRDQQEEYSGPEIETLYARWKAGDRMDWPTDSCPKQDLPQGNLGRFSTYLLEHSYDLFGNVTAY